MRQNVGLWLAAALGAAATLPAAAQPASPPAGPQAQPAAPAAECNSWCRVVRTFSPPPPAPAAVEPAPAPAPRRVARKASEEATPGPLAILVDRDGVNAALVGDIGAALDGVEKVAAVPADKPLIADLLSRPKADAALVTRFSLDRSKAADKLVSVVKLFPQELHAIAGSSVGSLEDLNGCDVYVGPQGSDSAQAVEAILEQRSIAVNPAYGTVEDALRRVREGTLAAAFVLAPKPYAPLAAMGPEDGLKLLPMAHRTDDAGSLPGAFTAETYPNLVPAGGRIETVALETALVAPRWRESSPRQKELAAFARALLERLPTLAEEGHHPKWRELNAATEVVGLRRLKVAQEWVRAKLKERERVGSREGRQQVGEVR